EVRLLDDIREREVMREKRGLEQHGGHRDHRRGGVEGAATHLDEDGTLFWRCALRVPGAGSGPEGQQRGEAAEHEARQKRAGAKVTKDHDVYGWVEKRDGHFA